MCLRLILVIYIISIPSLFAHDNKKKKSLESHEHGVGILNIAQEENTLVFEFEIPGFDIIGFEYEAKTTEDVEKVDNALNILSDYKNMIKPSNSGECEKTSSSAKVINEGKHSEFIAEYKFICKNISKLNRVFIKYFSKFENSKKLNIKIFGNNKKSAYVINKSNTILNVKNHF